MKRAMFVVVVMAVVMGISVKSIAQDPFVERFFSNRSYRGHGYISYNMSWYGRGGYYNGYYGGYYGRYYGLGHPNENVRVKARERWNVQGGESSYEQEPSLEAKALDAATLLGALLIIFH